ncbi:TMS membrane protein/tumor differentially expressed protein [Hortaea werneckii]|nr:TMS membrane protein/tumor differentially expressed protein [Hortaea werneckii]
MAKDIPFKAYNLERRGRLHTLPTPPAKITRHRMDRQVWARALSEAPSAGDAAVKGGRGKRSKGRKAGKVKSPKSAAGVCGPKCYAAFRTTNFLPSRSIEIRGPGEKGYGAFTAPGIRIPKDQWLDEYIGELLPLPNPDTASTDTSSLYRLWIPGTAIIDAERAGNWTRFVNSSCSPNVRVWGESVGKRQVVLFQALREIGPQEELTFQYGAKYFVDAGLQQQTRMGALLSLPLMAVPSVGTLLTFAGSCCGAATCSAICTSCGSCGNSIMTRIAYALILLLNSLLSWILLTPWAIKKLQHVMLDYVQIDCGGSQCFGFTAVHRVNFALGLLHFLLGMMLLGVNNSRDKRAGIQNGFWGPKVLAWIGLIVISFLIPNRFFEIWGNYVALVGAVLFLLLGLILLVDLAHTFAEFCIEKIEDTDSGVWRGVLIGSTLGMYLGAIAMTIVMYIFFAHSGCSMNQAAITINLILLISISVMSIHPTIQASNPRAGLAQAATVSIYCTYLTFSAVAMEPDDKHCNPLVRATGTRTASIFIGAIVTFVTCAYTTTRAATYGLAMGTAKPAGYSPVETEESGSHGLVDTQPESRRAMRQEALRRAVESGALPASALDDDDSDDEEESASGKHKNDDEKNGTQYNYTLFHIIFMLATAWVATLLTQNIGGDHKIEKGDFVPVGRTYWASWVKIVSSWVCYGIFGWTLGAPVMLPDRFDYS